MVFPTKAGVKTMLSDTNKLVRETEYDVPEFKKFLFCIPLKPAMFIWAILQTGLISFITILALVNFSSYLYPHFYSWTVVLMFIFTMIVSVMEMSMVVFLIISTAKSKWENINVCYNYTLIKIIVYFGLIIVSQFFYVCCYSQNWFYYHLDPVRYYVLRENPIAGLFECAILGYMALLMRSYIKQLGGNPHCLCSRRRCHETSENFNIQQDFAYNEKTDSYDKQNLYTVT